MNTMINSSNKKTFILLKIIIINEGKKEGDKQNQKKKEIHIKIIGCL
jgi:hypothetical protein